MLDHVYYDNDVSDDVVIDEDNHSRPYLTKFLNEIDPGSTYIFRSINILGNSFMQKNTHL